MRHAIPALVFVITLSGSGEAATSSRPVATPAAQKARTAATRSARTTQSSAVRQSARTSASRRPATRPTVAEATRPGYTTPSPAGYVYRRVGTPAPDAEVTPVDVVAAQRAAQQRALDAQPGRLPASVNARGAVSGGVGVDAPSLPSANRQPGASF